MKPDSLARQIRFSLDPDSGASVGFVLQGERILGIAPELSLTSALREFGGQQAGLSKHHAMLGLDAQGNVQVTDLDSKNHTWVNGEQAKPGTPIEVRDGDTLTLGTLSLTVSIPSDDTASTPPDVDPVWSLTTIAKALTSQLELDYILHQILQLSRSMTSAREALVWLMDEPSQELYLRAELGIEEERIRHIRLLSSDPLVSSVLESGQPLRASRSVTGEKVKIKTGYLVEAVLYVPLIVGAQKLGVLAAIHRDYDSSFSPEDERLLAGIGDFAAIAIQNASNYQQVQQMNRWKDEMIQNISHEFRTPLQYFRGYVSLMLDDRDKVDPEHYGYLEVLNQQADRLRWLISNFISLENLHGKKVSLIPVDLNYILSSAVHGAQALAQSRHITVVYKQTEHLPVVPGHLGKLCQVVDNLLSNALKFTPEAGTIEVWGELSDGEHDVLVHVQDSGIGIDPADQARIFDRFYQVDGTTSRQQGGVGIGLSVCKSIIEQHNGQIWVSSTPGKGSTFTISLPVMNSQDLEAYA